MGGKVVLGTWLLRIESGNPRITGFEITKSLYRELENLPGNGASITPRSKNNWFMSVYLSKKKNLSEDTHETVL